MIQITGRTQHQISPPLPVHDCEGTFEFVVPRPTPEGPIHTFVKGDGSALWSEASLSISEALAAALRLDTRRDNLSPALREEMRENFGPLSRANHRVFDLAIQELHKHEGHYLSNPRVEWSADREAWHAGPEGDLIAVCWSHSVPALTPRTARWLQRLIDQGEEALAATDHIFEAWRARSARFGWIEATIAAELAIKEVLARVEPKLETLLFEVPSAPITTLYGPILEEVCGKRSPYLKQLGEGARRRNRLIHRPGTSLPDGQEFRDYVEVVEAAIEHLLKLARSRERYA